MKYLMNFLISSLIVFSANASEKQVTVQVDGMTCPSCAASVEKHLKTLPQVKSVNISLAKSTVIILLKENASVTDAEISKAIQDAGYKVKSIASPDKSAHKDAASAMKPINLAMLREEFNRNSTSVRMLSILSPTCHYCQSGHRVIEDVFKKEVAKNLAGLIVWLPMLSGDDDVAASKQAGTFHDDRVVAEGWDSKSEIGKSFASILKLKGTAWDVYLIYPAGVKWSESAPPPKPKFWMHQLKKASGADPKFCLIPSRFSSEIAKELAALGDS